MIATKKGYLSIQWMGFFLAMFVNCICEIGKAASGDIYILAVDVATSGPSFEKNALLSIGACVLDTHEKEIKHFKVNIQVPDKKGFSEEAQKFWEANLEAFRSVTVNPLAPTEAMEQFIDFMRAIDALEKEDVKIFMVSPHPSFDVGWIDYYLDQYAQRLPLRYFFLNKKYRMIWEAGSIQKYWCCMKWGIASIESSDGHQHGAQWRVSMPHDHYVLNNARKIAQHFFHMREQIMAFIQEKNVVSISPVIQLMEYSNDWPVIFSLEESVIKKALGELCLEVHHVGSTSVCGLLAKPIIDMILVIPKETASEMIDKALATVDYHYQGNDPLFFLRIYGKRKTLELYLHVYENGSAEIDRNIKIRDYLRAHPEEKDRYAMLKKDIIEANMSSSRKASKKSIIVYNLFKNAFIIHILNKASFDGIYLRFCTQNMEWDVYKKIKKEQGGSDKDASYDAGYTRHLVLYKGTLIVGAAAVDITPPEAWIRFIGSNSLSSKENEKIICEFLGLIEYWAKRSGVFLIMAPAGEQISHFICHQYILTEKEFLTKNL